MIVTSVLTLCTGNICRSPIAEFVLAERLSTCDVSSAGLHAMVGRDADPSSVLAGQHLGVTVKKHAARQFTADLGQAADLILVMDAGHLQELRARHPDLSSKAFLLRCDRKTSDVPDPYRQGIANHYRAVELIIEGCGDWVKKIQES